MTRQVLFGFHALGIRLKVAPRSVVELHVDAARRDPRMQQFVARARDAGARLVESDDQRLQKLAGSPRHQGVVGLVEPLRQAKSLDDLLDAIEP
jgi:23S rRNA (guanosine2251-2'-O)-methyltransferase